jgi:hypothetical protein
MKYYCSFLLVLAFSITCLFGQDEAMLVSVLEDIKTQIVEVSGKSDTYDQTFTWNEATPYKIKFIVNIIDKKGNSEEMTYEFNLRDIDKNTIKVKNNKDLMIVPLFMDNRQKLVKVFKDGKQEKYSDKLEIAAIDVDNARNIEALLEKAIPIAEKIKISGIPESFEDRIAWLSQNIVPIEIEDTNYDQAFEQDKDLPVVVHYSLNKQGEKSSDESWHFNLSDLKERTVQMEIKGKEVRVEMQTIRKLKFIEFNKDDKATSYTDGVAFFTDDPDKGRAIAEVLKGLINQSQALEKNRFPEIVNAEAGFALLTEKISNLDAKGKTYTQAIDAGCISTLTQDVTDSKSNTTENKYLFNLADLNDKVDIKVSGKGILLSMETGKNKLIQSFEDGEMQNYINKLSIMAKDVENAKYLLHVLPATIKHCKDKKEEGNLAAKGGSFDWIKQHIVEVDNIRQVVEKVEGAECKWQFITTKSGKKEDTEEIYEFNLFDLDPQSLDFKISGKSLAIQLSTRHKEKNIKYYKNGEPGDYKNNFIVTMDNIEKARLLMRTWEKAIEDCKE